MISASYSININKNDRDQQQIPKTCLIGKFVKIMFSYSLGKLYKNFKSNLNSLCEQVQDCHRFLMIPVVD